MSDGEGHQVRVGQEDGRPAIIGQEQGEDHPVRAGQGEKDLQVRAEENRETIHENPEMTREGGLRAEIGHEGDQVGMNAARTAGRAGATEIHPRSMGADTIIQGKETTNQANGIEILAQGHDRCRHYLEGFDCKNKKRKSLEKHKAINRTNFGMAFNGC